MANPFFNATYYLANNPDLTAAGINTADGAWAHYVNYGASEAVNGATSRAPAPWFDINYYLSSNPDLLTAGIAPGDLFAHFTTYGINEGRAPSSEAAGQMTEANLLAYALGNPDLMAAFGIDAGATSLTAAQQQDLANQYYAYGYNESRPDAPFDPWDNGGSSTFNLTVNPDTATANIFNADRGWTPGGTDQMNTLNDDDVLTGTGDNPTLNFTYVDDADTGINVITPTLTGIETINVAVVGTPNLAGNLKVLDLQDATGVDHVNVSRINDGQNFAASNIAEALTSMSVNNSQASTANVAFTFLNKALAAGDNAADVTLNNAALGNLVIQSVDGTEGYETLNLNSVGSANTVGTLFAEDLEVLNIAGDQNLTLGGNGVVRQVVNGRIEAERHDNGLANVAGSLHTIDASGFTGDLDITLGAEINATLDNTSGVPVNFQVKGGSGDDTFRLADGVIIGGTATNTDTIDGGAGNNTLVINGGTIIQAGTAATIANVQGLEIRTGHDDNVLPPFPDTVNVNANAFDGLETIYVRNEGQTFNAANSQWVSAFEVMNVNLTNLTADQANGITLAHGTTGNSGKANNNLTISQKANTASDSATFTIVDGVNTDPVFNANITATAIEKVTFVDSDSESNTINLSQGAYTQAGSTITVQDGEESNNVNQYFNLDSFGAASAAAAALVPGAVNGNGYGFATDGTAGSYTTAVAALGAIAGVPTAVSTSARDGKVSDDIGGVFYGTAGTAGDGAVRHVVENIDTTAFTGDFIVRLGDVTRADGTTSMVIKTGSGKDTLIFDAIGSTNAGFTSGDTITTGGGWDTLVIDGNTATIAGTPRISVQTSEWDNVSGVDALRLGNNEGVANVGNGNQVTNAGGAYYIRIDDEFIQQTDAGNRLTIVNNDGDLAHNTESDAVIDLTGLSQNMFTTFVGANGVGLAGISSNRVVVADSSAKSGQHLNGGDTDVRDAATAGYVAGNNNVYEVRNTADVSINDLANTSNFGLINFTNNQATDQTLTLALNNTVLGALVDSSSMATAAAPEVLRIVATDGASNSVLNVDATQVTGFHALNVTGGGGADIINLDSNVGGTGSTLNLGLTAGDRVNWTGTANGAVGGVDGVVINQSGGVLLGTANGTHVFTTNATSTVHNVGTSTTGVEIVDISGMTYNSSVINLAAMTNAVTVIGGNQADVITGSNGNDTINGGAGNDTITGGAGADVLTGGAGTNAFVFAAGDSGQTATTLDTITDWAVGTNSIDFGATVLTADAGTGLAGTTSVNAAGLVTSTAYNNLAGFLADLGSSSTATAGTSLVFSDGANSYLFISDGVAGLGANDVLIELQGVNATAGLTFTGGDITAIA